MRCRICHEGIEKAGQSHPRGGVFLDLGQTPLANALVSPENLDKPDPTYPLALEFCPRCSFAQLTTVVNPREMFLDYPWVTGTTAENRLHFRDLAADVVKRCSIQMDSFVVDIGSNDGTLLRAFQEALYGVHTKVVGIEPAANVAKIAQAAGIETYVDFFDRGVVERILQEHGNADVITATNVFTHIDDLHGFMENVDRLLNPNGSLVLEMYYLPTILDAGLFDLVYHEHLSYFTVRALNQFFEDKGYTLTHVEKTNVFGGSLRAYAAFSGQAKPDKSVHAMLDGELDTFDLWDHCELFGWKVDAVKRDLLNFLEEAHERGERVVGYGAPARATTLLNFCKVLKGSIAYIVDDNPLKHGKYVPGVRIPIYDPEALWADAEVDHVLILAWNFAEGIHAKVREHLGKSVKTYVAVPELVELS